MPDCRPLYCQKRAARRRLTRGSALLLRLRCSRAFRRASKVELVIARVIQLRLGEGSGGFAADIFVREHDVDCDLPIAVRCLCDRAWRNPGTVILQLENALGRAVGEAERSPVLKRRNVAYRYRRTVRRRAGGYRYGRIIDPVEG
jgi:hypothetical protein